MLKIYQKSTQDEKLFFYKKKKEEKKETLRSTKRDYSQQTNPVVHRIL